MPYSLSSVERQNQILQYIQQNRRMSIADICLKFTISEATARRDLETLDSQGKVQRVHGGAIATDQTPPEAPILHRRHEAAAEKIRIAEMAVSLIKEGETIFLGSGTTVLETARALRGRKKVTVITNSLPVINTLAGVDGIDVIVLGGMLRETELSFIGHITEQALAEVRADKVIIGIRAIDIEHGLTNEYLPETLTDRAILRSGREIIILADHTKFDRTATVLLAPLESIHTIVTGNETDSKIIEALQANNIKVITV